MFFEEFPTLDSEYSRVHRDLAFIIKTLPIAKTLLNDQDLVQLMDMPTHKRGHVLDLVIVRRDASCLSLETIEDIALSDHRAIYCSVNVGRPTAQKRLVTSRSLRAMNSADFQADMKSFAETAGDQCADSGLLDVYDTGLRQALDHHAPLTTRRVSDRPSVPWMTDDIKAAKRELRRAEGQRRDRRKQRGVVKTFVRAARKLHFSARIENCSNTEELFSVSNGLLGKSKTAPLSSDIPRSALLDRFRMFFSKKKSRISDKTSMLTLLNQQHSLPMMVLNSVFSSLSQKRRFVNSLLNRLPKNCMLDLIPTSLTKECLSDLLPLIIRIVNSSLFWSHLSSSRP